jgi:WD40 repeat protein
MFGLPIEVGMTVVLSLVLPQEPVELETNIAKLGSKNFEERERATKALEKAGPKALPSLRHAEATHTDPEVRRRANQLIQALELRQMDPHSFRAHDLEVYQVGFTNDGRYVLTSGYDRKEFDFGTFRIWDGENYKEILHFKGKGIVYCFALSPDGKMVATGAQNGDLCLWDIATGHVVRLFDTSDLHVMALAYSPDGRWLLSGSNDGNQENKLQLWDIRSGKEVATLQHSKKATYAIAWLPDGNSALSAGKDRIIRLWDVKARKETLRLEGHTDTVVGLVISPDGRRALSSSWEGTIRLWDLKTGRELRRFLGHSDFVKAVKFTPDGRRAVSASHDRTVRVWDIETGKELRRFEGHGVQFADVAISPDGKHVVCGCMDGKAWDCRLID